MYKAPRGTTDIIPKEQSYWRFVEDSAAEICRLYGYGRIDTPVFEQTGLFLHSVGEGTDIVDKQMYTFDDHGGDQMTLRPEGTAPVCRAYIEHGMNSLPQPVRLYYLTSIFRYERPQAGRYRQHHQFGVEAMGIADPALDAEVISMAWGFYAVLGLRGLTLQLNSIGCQVCRPGYLQKLKDYYSTCSQTLCPDCRARLSRNPLRLLDCKNPACQEIVRRAPAIPEHLCAECARHFDAVRDYLQQVQVPYELNPYLVRGLDYYTRTVFEVQPEELKGQSAIGGGGRYDNLIEQLGGRPTPGVGFGTGIERIILNLQQQSIDPPCLPGATASVLYVGEKAKVEAIKLASRLRQAGIGATLAVGDRSLKSQLKVADSQQTSHVLIIGENELERGVALLRNMARGEQADVPMADVVDRLKNDV
ncbi:MAG: histidine--tRNA ligase [Chloroflexi bacterium]|nr:histidine--tRNA ligase [Chloroflexota bacterium]